MTNTDSSHLAALRDIRERAATASCPSCGGRLLDLPPSHRLEIRDDGAKCALGTRVRLADADLEVASLTLTLDLERFADSVLPPAPKREGR
jgi:hypothetical protein